MLRNFSFEEYLRFDEAGISKNEYYQGEILAIPSGTVRHNAIALQMAIALGNCASQKNCTLFSSDTRLYIPLAKLSVYPDLMLICEKIEFYQKRKDIVLNPTLIAEVLSPSTEKYDRQIKLPAYLAIPSVEIIVLVDPKTPYMEVYQRKQEWKKEVYKEGIIDLLACEMNLLNLYQTIRHLD